MPLSIINPKEASLMRTGHCDPDEDPSGRVIGNLARHLMSWDILGSE